MHCFHLLFFQGLTFHQFQNEFLFPGIFEVVGSRGAELAFGGVRRVNGSLFFVFGGPSIIHLSKILISIIIIIIIISSISELSITIIIIIIIIMIMMSGGGCLWPMMCSCIWPKSMSHFLILFSILVGVFSLDQVLGFMFNDTWTLGTKFTFKAMHG